jgi:hypothetical protein
MSDISLSAYYMAAYIVMRAGHPGWEQLHDAGLPEKLISLSTCICRQRHSVAWSWSLDRSREEALIFGIPSEQLDAYVDWGLDAYAEERIGVWSVFYTLDTAREFIQRFVPDSQDLHLLGVGLRHDLTEGYWQQEWQRIPPSQPEGDAVKRLLDKRLTLPSGGQILGFEVASYAYSDFGHSWLCSGLNEQMREMFGFVPDAHGLLQSEADAMRLFNWIAEDELKGQRSEPEPYFPWLLVDYPLSGGPEVD